MTTTVISKINFTPAMKLIKDDDFWLFGIKEWQRLLYDYIPYRKGNLRNNVRYKPKKIEYVSPYARYIYYGMKMVDPVYKKGGFTADGGATYWSRPGVKKVATNMPLSFGGKTTRLWDKKAIQEKKDLILIRTMQNYIDRNL